MRALREGLVGLPLNELLVCPITLPLKLFCSMSRLTLYFVAVAAEFTFFLHFILSIAFLTAAP